MPSTDLTPMLAFGLSGPAWDDPDAAVLAGGGEGVYRASKLSKVYASPPDILTSKPWGSAHQ
jgi:hypothetical protein